MADTFASRRERDAVAAVDAAILARLRKTKLREVTPPDIAVPSVLDPDVRTQVLAGLHGKFDQTGQPLPWHTLSNYFRLRPGELTAVIGPNGEKKTTFVSHIAAHAALAGHRVYVLSLEMTRSQQLTMMARQCLVSDFTDERLDALLQSLAECLTVNDHRDDLSPRLALGMVLHAVNVLQSELVIIDNLTCVVDQYAVDTNSVQTRFVRSLQRICQDTGAHVLLVGHVRKPEAGRMITRYDWRGAGAASDVIDNVLCVQLNPKKKPEVHGGDEPLPKASFDTLVRLDKQRFGPSHQLFRMWYWADSRRLTSADYAPEPFFTPPTGTTP